jgi:GAF domain-containing protein
MAFTRNEPILRDGLLFHSGRTRRLVQEEGLRTIAAVPLTNNGEPFGVLAVASHHNRDWSSRDQRMLLSISQKVGQAIANSKKFSEVEEQAQAWETNNVALQQANAQLTARANSLEKQVEELRRVEQQIWIALAASSKARYRTQDENGQYEDLVTTLKKALATMNKKRTELLH